MVRFTCGLVCGDPPPVLCVGTPLHEGEGRRGSRLIGRMWVRFTYGLVCGPTPQTATYGLMCWGGGTPKRQCTVLCRMVLCGGGAPLKGQRMVLFV